MAETVTQSMGDWADGWVIVGRTQEPARPFREYVAERWGVIMAESTRETLDRLARALRSEAAEIAANQIKNHGSLKDPVRADRDFQRGAHEAYRHAADLLDEGKGK